jgi:hypothetical protein
MGAWHDADHRTLRGALIISAGPKQGSHRSAARRLAAATARSISPLRLFSQRLTPGGRPASRLSGAASAAMVVVWEQCCN